MDEYKSMGFGCLRIVADCGCVVERYDGTEEVIELCAECATFWQAYERNRAWYRNEPVR